MQNGSTLKETKKFDLSHWYFYIYRQVYKMPCMSSLSGLRSLGWALRIHVCHPLVGITPQSNHTCSTTTLPHLRWKVLRATMSRSLRGVSILVHSSRTPCPEPASVDFSPRRGTAGSVFPDDKCKSIFHQRNFHFWRFWELYSNDNLLLYDMTIFCHFQPDK